MQIIPATPEKVRVFIGKMGDSAEYFRYFNTRNVDVISQHLITLIGESPAENPVAYGHLDPEQGRVWLGICVAGECRSCGFGRQMMEALLNAAAANGVKMLHLTVDSDNTRAIEFYEKIGFELEETQESYQRYRYIVR